MSIFRLPPNALYPLVSVVALGSIGSRAVPAERSAVVAVMPPEHEIGSDDAPEEAFSVQSAQPARPAIPVATMIARHLGERISSTWRY